MWTGGSVLLYWCYAGMISIWAAISFGRCGLCVLSIFLVICIIRNEYLVMGVKRSLQVKTADGISLIHC